MRLRHAINFLIHRLGGSSSK